jgi:uncharacterized beta-barrel protein YwiB (DUF1934 family)
MTKDVLVTVRGRQIGLDTEDDIEVINVGTYAEKNGKLYIRYDERDETNSEVIKNQIKIDGSRVEIMKKGSMGAQMFFEENERVNSCYETPFGSLMMTIYTNSVDCKRNENLIELNIRYTIEMNGEHLSDANVNIKVQPMGGGSIRLSDMAD